MSRTAQPRLAVPLAVGLSLLAVGCVDAPEPTAPVGSGAPTLASAKSPPQSGPNVIRIPLGVFFSPFPEQGVSLTAGLESTPGGLCAGTEPFVTSPGVEQQVTPRSGALQILAKSREAKLVLYGAATGDFCALANIPVLGTGTGSLQVTLVNITGQGPGATTFVERVRGTITLASGGQLRVRMLNMGVIRPDGTVAHERTTLVLTPLGSP